MFIIIPQHIIDTLHRLGVKPPESICKENGKEIVEIDICEKGNREVIEELISLGWVKMWRQKKKTNYSQRDPYIRQYKGYVFRVRLKYFI